MIPHCLRVFANVKSVWLKTSQHCLSVYEDGVLLKVTGSMQKVQEILK